MGKKQTVVDKPTPTFEVRFVGPDLLPETIPLRAVSDALAAVQDLACGRDSFEEQHVPPEKSIGLIDVRRGSAVFSCVSRSPDEAVTNLARVGRILSATDQERPNGDSLITALRPIQSLSDVARSVGCRVEVTLVDRHKQSLFAVEQDDYRRISSCIFMRGETTIEGTVERVGGATGLKCLLRVPGRRRILYCNVRGRELAQRLGQHLYEKIAATGMAVWIHRSWRVHEFTINDFTQPRLGDSSESIAELRSAGLDAWDQIDDPERYVRELRS